MRCLFFVLLFVFSIQTIYRACVRTCLCVHENMNAKCESRIANIHEMLKTKRKKSTTVIKISVDFGCFQCGIDVDVYTTHTQHERIPFPLRILRESQKLCCVQREREFICLDNFGAVCSCIRACVRGKSFQGTSFRARLFCIPYTANNTLFKAHRLTQLSYSSTEQRLYTGHQRACRIFSLFD